MRLPNGNQAVVDEAKLTDYVLNTQHDDGKHKARLFGELLGFSIDNVTVLSDALKRAAETGDAKPGRLDLYGQRYSIDFELTGPIGVATVRSAWIIRTGEATPRLVTCFPL